MIRRYKLIPDEKKTAQVVQAGAGNIIFVNEFVRVLRSNMPHGQCDIGELSNYGKGVQDTLNSLLAMLGEK